MLTHVNYDPALVTHSKHTFTEQLDWHLQNNVVSQDWEPAVLRYEVVQHLALSTKQSYVVSHARPFKYGNVVSLLDYTRCHFPVVQVGMS